jgi:hypothetical protein
LRSGFLISGRFPIPLRITSFTWYIALRPQFVGDLAYFHVHQLGLGQVGGEDLVVLVSAYRFVDGPKVRAYGVFHRVVEPRIGKERAHEVCEATGTALDVPSRQGRQVA